MGTRVANSGDVTEAQVSELRNSSYEVFILLLSLLSLGNIVLLVLPLSENSTNVVLIVDLALSVVFLADFAYRLLTAESKGAYMGRGGGWLDLIGSLPLPGLRLARVFRVARALRAVREHGARGLARDFMRQRAQGAMYVVLLLVVVVLEFAGIGVLAAEDGSENANIRSASDALWWGYVTITTVGYGDRYPVTNEGRIVGVFLLTVGVGLFGTFTGFLANFFLAPTKDGADASASETQALQAELDARERTIGHLSTRLRQLETDG